MRIIALLIASVGAVPTGFDDSTFLANWMGNVLPVIQDLTILDMSLPGTHDTLTYDLSTTVAPGGIDGPAIYSEILHAFGSLGSIGEYIRTQAQSQILSVTEQLDNGIRFLDFRIMKTDKDWHSLHFMQSKSLIIDYIKQVHAWLVAHPKEIVVMWLSKHGNEHATGNDQYPGVSVADKQKFWAEIEAVFGGLLMDHSSPPNKATIKDLLKINQRILLYTSDYLEFTGGSTKAWDASPYLDNGGSSSIGDEVAGIKWEAGAFQGGKAKLAKQKPENKFWLMSLANSQPSGSLWPAAKLNLAPGGTFSVTGNRKDCASQFTGIPDFDKWCPGSLLHVGQLTNYYKQIAIEAALQHGWGFPNAFYMDAVDVGGKLRTGPKPLTYAPEEPTCDAFYWTGCGGTATCDKNSKQFSGDSFTSNGKTQRGSTVDTWDIDEHGTCVLPWATHHQCCRDEAEATTGYAYVDTLVLYNLMKRCEMPNSPAECDSMMKAVQTRRAQAPMKRWNDTITGRRTDWPPLPWAAQDDAAAIVV